MVHPHVGSEWIHSGQNKVEKAKFVGYTAREQDQGGEEELTTSRQWGYGWFCAEYGHLLVLALQMRD